MKYRVVLIPFLVFLSAYTIDKFILLGNFPFYYLTTASFVNFENKEKLVYDLKSYLQTSHRKKVLVILGNSRTMAFDNKYIEEKYPNWILYNFSVPGGIQDYFYYILKKFRDLGIKPDALFIAITPQGMNKTPAVFTDEVMIFGLPFSFLLSEWNHYNLNEWSNYIGKMLFVTYRYRPKYKVIQFRSDPVELYKFANLIVKTSYILEKERGSVPSSAKIKIKNNSAFLEKNADSLWKDFFVPYEINENALYFLERVIVISKEEIGIPTIYLLWPPVSPQLLKRKTDLKIVNSKKTVYEIWISKIKELQDKYNVPLLDLNVKDSLTCKEFYDASHLSTQCYAEYTEKIFKTIINK